MVSSLTVVVMLQILLLHTLAADVNLSLDPDQIKVGLSPSLDVNCTTSFSGNSSMVEIMSLTVTRGSHTELASITTFSDHQANVISNEGITADGVINPGGQSYIHLHWDNPTDTQEGTYQCSARGMDPLGHIVVSTDVSVVTIKQVDMLDLLNKLQEMSNYTEELEERLVQSENYTKELEERLSLKDDYIKDLEQNVSGVSIFAQMVKDSLPCAFIDPPLAYQNTKYVVSQLPFTDFNDSIDICKAIGGQLAEINDIEEYHAIQSYLRTLTGFDHVYLGGTDEGHDGTWVVPSTNEDLPVTDWHGTEPDSGEVYNCLCLYGAHGWMMTTHQCHWDTPRTTYRYMCKI